MALAPSLSLIMFQVGFSVESLIFRAHRYTVTKAAYTVSYLSKHPLVPSDTLHTGT